MHGMNGGEWVKKRDVAPPDMRLSILTPLTVTVDEEGILALRARPLAPSEPPNPTSFSDREMTANILFHHIRPRSSQNDLATIHHRKAVCKLARKIEILFDEQNGHFSLIP